MSKVMLMNNTRLADIAAQAGVSEATVSRVLNGKAGVSPATRQAVLTALDLMGYERPQRLRQRSNGLIGLVIPELGNPIFPAFAQAMEKSLIQHGYTPILCTQEPGGAPEDEFTEMLLDRGVSGIVFVSGLHADTTARMDRYTRLTDRGLPIVLVDGYNEAIPVPFISPDDRLAARLAVQHLVDLGHERIGLALGQRRFVPVIRKIEGFRQAMAQLLGPADVDDLIQHSLFSVEGGQAAASALLGAARPRLHRDLLRERPHGARRDPRRPRAGAVGARGRVGRRVRRLAADGVHRPAADDRAQADRRDGGRRRRDPARGDRRHSRQARRAGLPA